MLQLSIDSYNEHLEVKNMEIFNILIRNIKKILTLKSTTDLAKKLSTNNNDFSMIFFRANSDILPSHRFYNHKIPLMKKKPCHGVFGKTCFKMNWNFWKILQKKFIKIVFFPTASPVIFIRKPGNSLRFCVDCK